VQARVLIQPGAGYGAAFRAFLKWLVLNREKARSFVLGRQSVQILSPRPILSVG
jgi:hypothetical protein